MADFDTGLPSVRQIQGFIKDQKRVEIKLITNDSLEGKILWQDVQCICLVESNNQRTMIWRQAIAYLKAKD